MTAAISAGSYLHFAVHFGIAGAIVAAAVWNVVVLRRIMRIRAITTWGLLGLAVGCAATHIGIALGIEQSTEITVLEYIEFLGLLAFILGLFLDSRRLVIRAANAMHIIEEEFDGLVVVRGERGRQMADAGEAERLNCGPVVLATLDFALHGKADQPGPGAG